MVVFTCSYCGEPVKKPAVSKHYDTRCRGRNPNLTCVDCLKDFRGTEYEAHTKCISESERYGAKGSFAGNSVNKGEKKQQEWSEHIQKVLQSNTLRPDERKVLDIIAKHENVPRQKKKFENFINSAYRSLRFSNELINRVWEKIKPAENKNNNSSTQPAGKENTFKPEQNVSGSHESKKRKHDEALSELISENTNGVSDSPKLKKNKKSKKEKGQDVNQMEVTEEGAALDNVKPESSKKRNKNKKKSQKAKEENGEEPQDKIVGDEVNDVKSKSSKKKDKKKKKAEEPIGEDKAHEIVVKNGAGIGSNKKKGKKKLKNKTLENAKQETTGIEPPEKKKKDRKKKAVNGESLESTQEIINDEKLNSKSNFCWVTAISNVLAKKGDEEKILIDTLQKKVFKKFSKATGNEVTVKQRTRFSKKLKKLAGITIKDQYVIVHKNEN